VQAIPSFEFAEHPVDVAGGVPSSLTISQLSDRDRGPHGIDRNLTWLTWMGPEVA